MVRKVDPCHLTPVRVDRHSKSVFLVESLSFANMDCLTHKKLVEIIKFYYENVDSSVSSIELCQRSCHREKSAEF